MENRIGFGRRLGAYFIDFLFVLGIAFILSSLFGDFLEKFVDFSKITDEQLEQMQSIYGNFTDLMLTISVSSIVAGFIYNLVEGFTGYTLGKLMLGIQIGNQDGTPAEQNTLMVRFALKNISFIIGLIGAAAMISTINTVGTVLGIIVFIGCFFALGDKKLALHDMIAKTAVFRKSELADGTAAKPMFTTPTE